jgi:mannose-6-phosphate isomerase-like protein (cupin superfamily)
VFFAGSLRAVLEAAGQSIGAGIGYALAAVPGRLDPAAAQALNVLSNDLVLTNTAGLFLFGLAAGIAILRGRRLPIWLGWVAIAMAIVVVTPPKALAFVVLVVWMVVVAVLIVFRDASPRTSSRHRPSRYAATVPFVDPAELPSREPLPGWNGRFFHSEHMTFAYHEIDADALPMHEHHHSQEEVWNVVAGELAITIGGQERVLRPGCAAIVPANTAHSTRALAASRAIVVDYPVRAEVGGVST